MNGAVLLTDDDGYVGGLGFNATFLYMRANMENPEQKIPGTCLKSTMPLQHTRPWGLRFCVPEHDFNQNSCINLTLDRHC